MIGLKLIIAILFFAFFFFFFLQVIYSLGQSDRRVKSVEGGWGGRTSWRCFYFLIERD